MPTDPQPSAPPAPAPPEPGDPTTGVRHTTESLMYLLHQGQQELRSDLADLRAEWRASTWSVVVREQLDRPIWPGRWEVRLGTVLVLLAALVALFGSDRVWGALPDWLSPAGVAP